VGGELLLSLTLIRARKDHRGLCLGRLLCHLCLLSVSRSVCQGQGRLAHHALGRAVAPSLHPLPLPPEAAAHCPPLLRSRWSSTPPT
jgi:hypothetical protein